MKRLHRVQIGTLYNMKSLTDSLLPIQGKVIAKKILNMYRWMKWPFKVYRWVKKTSPIGITMEVGWLVARKGLNNFICRYTFDLAYRELETVYRQSKLKNHGNAT